MTSELFKEELQCQEVEITLSNNEKVSGIFRKWGIGIGYGMIKTAYLLIPDIYAPEEDIIGSWDEYGKYQEESKIKQNVLKIELKGKENDK